MNLTSRICVDAIEGGCGYYVNAFLVLVCKSPPPATANKSAYTCAQPPSTGTVGFFGCFAFVRKIYSVVKVD